jgi:hypothetical protein
MIGKEPLDSGEMTMLRFKIRRTGVAAFALGLALAVSGPAIAHGSMKPRHGGQVAMSGETVVELVRGPKGVSVYVTEEDEPIASAGLTGKLLVTQGAKKTTAALVAGPGNRLDAAGVKIGNGATVAVIVVTKATQARSVVNFTVK